MQLRTFDDPGRFYDCVRPLLLGQEDRYNLLIGVALRCRDGEPFGDDPPWMACVEQDGRALVAALQTPPRALNLTDASGEQLEPIVRALLDSGRSLPGVVGPAETAERFARRWCQATGVELDLHMSQRVHRLETVQAPRTASGSMRRASPEDLPLARIWAHRFGIDCRLPEAQGSDPPERVLALDEGRLFFWDDPEPVSMAAWSRPTPRGVSIGYVYTPDDLRGRGYASSLVAALSQQLLDEGKAFCCLFTDVANPTSNKIYARIGYRPVGEFRHYLFRS